MEQVQPHVHKRLQVFGAGRPTYLPPSEFGAGRRFQSYGVRSLHRDPGSNPLYEPAGSVFVSTPGLDPLKSRWILILNGLPLLQTRQKNDNARFHCSS